MLRFAFSNPPKSDFCLQKARFEKGKELLEAEFRNLLTRYSKPVPPILILDAISVDEELEVQEEVVLEHLPEAVLQDIICIAGWLVEYGRNQGTTWSSPSLQTGDNLINCLFYQTFVSVCRFHERLLPDQIQSAGSIHQRTEGTLPEEQRLLWRALLARRPDQTQGHAHQKGSQETRSATFTHHLRVPRFSDKRLGCVLKR